MPAKKDDTDTKDDIDHSLSHEKDQPEAAKLPEDAQALAAENDEG